MKRSLQIVMLLILGALSFASAISAQSVMKGVRVERTFFKDELRAIKTFDREGNCTFIKREPSPGMLQMQAVEYDAAGQPRREWTVVILMGTLSVTEIRYGQSSTQMWSPRTPLALNQDPQYAAANRACTLQGFPSSFEELFQQATLKAALAGDMYMQHEVLLDKEGNPHLAYDFDLKDQKAGEARYLYDAQARLVSKKEFFSEDTTDYTLNLHQYDALGNEIQAITLSGYIGREDTTFIEECRYEDRLLVERKKFQQGKSGMMLSKETFEYDMAGRLRVEEFYPGSELVPWRRYVYTYDAQGRRVQEESFKRIEGNFEPRGITKWEFEMW